MNTTVTRSGRVVKPPDQLIEVINALTEVLMIPSTKAELRYLARLSDLESNELGLVDRTTEIEV